MAGPWFCSQGRSCPTCPFVWRVQPVWAPKMSPSHPVVRHCRLLCGLSQCCLCRRQAIHLYLQRFLLHNQGKQQKNRSRGFHGYQINQITHRLNSWNTFLCQKVWSPVKTEILWHFAHYLRMQTPLWTPQSLGNTQTGNHPDSTGSCLA